MTALDWTHSPNIRKWGRVMRIFVIALGVCLLSGVSVYAQDLPGNVAEGRAFALEVCAECHIVAPDQEKAGTDAVPTFEAIAADPAVTQVSLRAFFQTPHAEMPDFIFSPIETDNIISYILSLRK